MIRVVQDKLRRIFDLESSGRMIFYSALVGIVAGLGAAVFYLALDGFEHAVLGELMGYFPPRAGTDPLKHLPELPTRLWALLLVPTLGGLACGWLVWCFAPEAEGHGTDAVIKAFHSQKGMIRGRVPPLKGLASIMTIGTGGSAGREGPISQIGAGVGSLVANRFRLSDSERRMLVLAGMAGGLGAIFGPGLAFTSRNTLIFHGASELPFYLVLAVLCALVGYVYVTFFYGVRNQVFARLPVPAMLKPAIGGLGVGLIALAFPQVMAGGYGWIQEAVDHNLSLHVVAKVPLAALIMVCEMSGTYNLLVPLMLVNVIVVAILSSRVSLFEEQVASLIDSPAHLGDFVVDILEGIKVREIYTPSRRPTLIRECMPLPEVLRLVADSNEHYFPVVDRQERLVGIFTLHDLRSALLGNGGGSLVLASDPARLPMTTVTPDANLHIALRSYAQKQIEEVPVVHPNDPSRVICMLRRGEVIAAYDERIVALKNGKSRA